MVIKFFYNHSFTRNLTLYLEVGGDKPCASQPAYTSNGFYGTLGSEVAWDSTNIQANLKAPVLQRNYSDSDPLWREVRRDSGQIYWPSITKQDFYILGLRSSIDVTYQSNNSNIPFFHYNKLFGGIFFKNVY